MAGVLWSRQSNRKLMCNINTAWHFPAPPSSTTLGCKFSVYSVTLGWYMMTVTLITSLYKNKGMFCLCMQIHIWKTYNHFYSAFSWVQEELSIKLLSEFHICTLKFHIWNLNCIEILFCSYSLLHTEIILFCRDILFSIFNKTDNKFKKKILQSFE